MSAPLKRIIQSHARKGIWLKDIGNSFSGRVAFSQEQTNPMESNSAQREYKEDSAEKPASGCENYVKPAAAARRAHGFGFD